MRWCTVEQAADVLGLEAWRLRDLAVLGGSPVAYGPMRVEGSAYRVMLDLDDVKAWDAAGRPVACSDYRKPRSASSAAKPRPWWAFWRTAAGPQASGLAARQPAEKPAKPNGTNQTPQPPPAAESVAAGLAAGSGTLADDDGPGRQSIPRSRVKEGGRGYRE